MALQPDAPSASFEQDLEKGDFYSVLNSSLARVLLDQEKNHNNDPISLQGCKDDWNNFLSCRVSYLLDHSKGSSISSFRADLFSIGIAAFQAFLQSNVTGPPLSWISSRVVFPPEVHDDPSRTERLEKKLTLDLSVDGETVYQLTPRVELFCLAKCLLNHEAIVGKDTLYIWGRLRVNFWHQRMLNGNVDSLQKSIYEDLAALERSIFNESSKIKAFFLVERATIHTHYGFDVKARKDLENAARQTHLEFALTGRLGKRTKFQQNELSQLVVLAKSGTEYIHQNGSSYVTNLDDLNRNIDDEEAKDASKPLNLDLNDDTLLEQISFSKEPPSAIQDEDNISPALKALDPANQPTLQPLDAIILLAVASSITNTSPQDGLTREETLPYATRVLTGGSTNWQVYTQALLVRSRIEGYRSRTVERGVLQLQTVVDQVIADTASATFIPPTIDLAPEVDEPASTTFLPKPKASESAPVTERLLYIHQLGSPTRWQLEAELADRWVTLGGLRTALEIYKRLQMWAEVALCWAACDREDEARKVIHNQLYNACSMSHNSTPTEHKPLPADAPRLFCILGDMEKSPQAYERAWEISNHRYARAQRSLGRHYLATRNLPKAEEAYAKSLRTSPQNHSAWFALGSVRLQLEDWMGAVDAYGRAIQIEEKDAESWSNLAAALLRLPPEKPLSAPLAPNTPHDSNGLEDDDETNPSTSNPQKHIQEAFVALKRAAVLKRESHRIWQNLLTVAVKLSPPPYTDIIIAQTRLIDLLGNIEGEKCIEVDVLERLVAHFIDSSSPPAPPSSSVPESPPNSSEPPNETDTRAHTTPPSRKPGFGKMLTDLVQKRITPLITTSRRLWLLTAKLSLQANHPFATLGAFEKAWRVTLNHPGWESGTHDAEAKWKDVVDATVDLADAYESLGERRREGGMGAGELVCKEWRFKSRSAIRAVLGRAKEGWAGSEGIAALEKKLRELRVG